MPPSRHRRWLLLGSALLGSCLIIGCATGAGDPVPAGQKKTYHYDAKLQFAIEVPSDWKLSRGQEAESCIVQWHAPVLEEKTETAAQASVVACPASRWPDGLAAMRAELLASHPGLTLQRRQDAVLPAGTGEALEGRDASRRYLVTLLTAERRGYIVSLSAPLSAFEANRPLFEEMLASFEPVATD